MFMKPRKPYLSCKSCKWESSLKRLSSVPADSSRSENQSWRQGQASSPALQELSWAVLFPPWLQAQALSTLQLEGLCHVCSVTTHRTHQLLTCRWTDTGSSRSESCRLEGGTSGPLRPLPVPLLLLPCPPLPSYRWGLDTAPPLPHWMPEVSETVGERQFQKGDLHAAGSGLGLKPHPRLVSACSWSRGLEGSRNSPSRNTAGISPTTLSHPGPPQDLGPGIRKRQAAWARGFLPTCERRPAPSLSPPPPQLYPSPSPSPVA